MLACIQDIFVFTMYWFETSLSSLICSVVIIFILAIPKANNTYAQIYIFLYDIGIYHDVEMHYNDVIMGSIASQITSLAIVYSVVYSGADQRKHQSSASLAFVWVIHRSPGQ